MSNLNALPNANNVNECVETGRDERTILVSQADYAWRTRRIYSECEDWMHGVILVDEFDVEQFGLWEPFECIDNGSFLDRDRVSNLTKEFEFVLELSKAIIGAIEIIVGHEHDDDVSPLSRAFYFASEVVWQGSRLDDYFPGKLVHSCAPQPTDSVTSPPSHRVYGDTQLRLFV